MVQALYVTERTYNNKTVNWVGTLHALWVDSAGNIREDTNNDARLSGYDVDKVVQVYYDSGTRQTRVCKFDSTSAETFEPIIINAGADCEANSLPLEDLGTLWNAREQLSAISSASITTQRTYSSTAANGRHVLAFVDGNRNGVVDTGEFVDFTPTGIDTATNHGYLNATTQAEADIIVNYIRGTESASTRNRTIDFNGDGTEEVLRLGDIVHSTPTLVSVPARLLTNSTVIQPMPPSVHNMSIADRWFMWVPTTGYCMPSMLDSLIRLILNLISSQVAAVKHHIHWVQRFGPTHPATFCLT